LGGGSILCGQVLPRGPLGALVSLRTLDTLWTLRTLWTTRTSWTRWARGTTLHVVNNIKEELENLLRVRLARSEGRNDIFTYRVHYTFIKDFIL
jgi:hypothetical protein